MLGFLVVSVEVKKQLGESTVTQTYIAETWTCDELQRSRIHAVEMGYLRRACGITSQNEENTKGMYGEIW